MWLTPKEYIALNVTFYLFIYCNIKTNVENVNADLCFSEPSPIPLHVCCISWSSALVCHTMNTNAVFLFEWLQRSLFTFHTKDIILWIIHNGNRILCSHVKSYLPTPPSSCYVLCKFNAYAEGKLENSIQNNHGQGLNMPPMVIHSFNWFSACCPIISVLPQFSRSKTHQTYQECLTDSHHSSPVICWTTLSYVIFHLNWTGNVPVAIWYQFPSNLCSSFLIVITLVVAILIMHPSISLHRSSWLVNPIL